MSLTLIDKTKTHIPIVKDISFDIAIENSLAPLHKTFPTMRIFIDFDKTIDLEIDLVALDQILRMKNLLLIQLENKEVQVVETRFKKLAVQKNKAMQL